jgi:hypothetical protein
MRKGVFKSLFPSPLTVPPGFHTISVQGLNAIGDPIAYQKVVYVAVDENDYNGNGIPNDQEPCVIFDASGVDEDQDGIDDACDGFIDQPPAPADIPPPLIVNPDLSLPAAPGLIQNPASRVVAQISNRLQGNGIPFGGQREMRSRNVLGQTNEVTAEFVLN